MSRVGKNPVAGPSGRHRRRSRARPSRPRASWASCSSTLHDDVDVELEDGKVVGHAARPRPSARAHACGAPRATWSSNMVDGRLRRASPRTSRSTASAIAPRSQGKNLKLQLGYSHDIDYPDPGGHHRSSARSRPRSRSPAPTSQQVGQVAAEIRAFRAPEPYKGKGIKYDDETDPAARKARRSKGRAMLSTARLFAAASGASRYQLRRKARRPPAAVACSARASTSTPRSSTTRKGATLAAASSLDKDAARAS